MKIGAVREIFEGENRVAMTPESAAQLQKLGHSCLIETGAGEKAGFSDAAYTAAGVEVLASAQAVFETVDVVTKVRPPTDTEVDHLRHDQTLISFLWPAQNSDLLELARTRGATVIAMDMVPRASST